MEALLEVVTAEHASSLSAIQNLWAEYWKWLDFPPDFQSFADEVRALPGKYGAPSGRLLLARVDGEPAGTAAYRKLTSVACEAKRLYVRPQYRRLGVAGALLEKLVQEARGCGYRALYGDTLRTMDQALAFYRQRGFVEVGPYAENPTPEAVYLRLDL